jgi:hypothetical protein
MLRSSVWMEYVSALPAREKRNNTPIQMSFLILIIFLFVL